METDLGSRCEAGFGVQNPHQRSKAEDLQQRRLVSILLYNWKATRKYWRHVPWKRPPDGTTAGKTLKNGWNLVKNSTTQLTKNEKKSQIEKRGSLLKENQEPTNTNKVIEDLCLKENNYKLYKEIATNIVAKKKERENYIAAIKLALETELNKCEVQSISTILNIQNIFPQF